MNKKIVIIVSCLVFFAICGILVSNRITAKGIKDGIVLGNKYYQDGKYEQAIIAFNGVIKIDSKNIDARAGLVQAYTKVNKPTEATRVAKEAIGINVKDPQGYLKIAKAYENVDKIDEAIKILTEGYRATKDATIKKKLEELVAEALAKNLKVDVDLEELLRNPDAYKYYEEGMAYLASSDYSKAIDSFSKAIDLDGTFADAYFQRGLATCEDYADKVKIEKALTDFTKAIELKPAESKYYFSRAHVYNNLSQRNDEFADKQLADALKYTELRPDDIEGYLFLGAAYSFVYSANNSNEVANKQVIAYTKALTLKGDRLYRAYEGRGMAYRQLKQYESSLTDLTEALRLNPSDTMILEQRGYTYSSMNEYVKAIEDFTNALKSVSTSESDERKKRLHEMIIGLQRNN